MDHDILYETDICTWAEQQAAVLRGLASRGELPNELDLANVVEEIEDVGNSPLSAVSSFIRLILSHAVLIAADADADEVLHWTHEIATFRGNLMQVYQRSMRQRIDMESVWRRALEEAGLQAGGLPWRGHRARSGSDREPAERGLSVRCRRPLR